MASARVMGWLPGEWQDYHARSKNWRAAHAHSVIAQRLSGMISACAEAPAAPRDAGEVISG